MAVSVPKSAGKIKPAVTKITANSLDLPKGRRHCRGKEFAAQAAFGFI